MNKPIISGMSTPFGIQFFGQKYTLYFENNGNYSIKKNIAPNIINKFENVPVLRGISFMINAIYTYIREATYTNVFLGILFLCGLFAFLFMSESNTVMSDPPLFVSIIIWLLMFVFIFKTRENHSIEHKLIGAHYSNSELTYDNVKSQPKENVRCGGVLVPYLFVFYFLVDLLPIEYYALQAIIVLPLSFEFFRLARTDGVIGKIFYFPGYLVQKLTTTNNIKEDRLKSAHICFEEFIKLEEAQ